VVKLRLVRMGKKKQPTYRIVAADSRSPRNGRFIEIVGTYEPRRDPSLIEIDNDKAVAWLKKGAQPTDRVAKLLEITGAWEQFKTGVAPAAPKPPPAKAEKPSKPAEAAAADDDGAEDAADDAAQTATDAEDE
jgi:small subunit ribosomal protein S16